MKPALLTTEHQNIFRRMQNLFVLREGIEALLSKVSCRHLASAACLMFVLQLDQSLAGDLALESIKLPALRVNGQAAKAHTQGMEIAAGQYFVTARRDDVLPKQALLLRTGSTRTDWDVWDITPVDTVGGVMALDHPGGMQSDGRLLWVPLAESKRNGRSIIRVYSIAGLVAGQPAKAEFEFPVEDHIGAMAVSVDRRLVFGASWDTEKVYVWNWQGRLQRTLSSTELGSRGLGVVTGPNGRAGLAVQDWKVVGDRLFASGLFHAPGTAAVSPASRFMSFAGFLETHFQRWSVALPTQKGIELGNEAMTISEGLVHFLPEDLGASNQVFRVSLADIMKQSAPQESRSDNAP